MPWGCRRGGGEEREGEGDRGRRGHEEQVGGERGTEEETSREEDTETEKERRARGRRGRGEEIVRFKVGDGEREGDDSSSEANP